MGTERQWLTRIQLKVILRSKSGLRLLPLNPTGVPEHTLGEAINHGDGDRGKGE